jgi:hypothetical protein
MNLSPRALMRAFKAAEKAGEEVIETEIDFSQRQNRVKIRKIDASRFALQARYRELHDQTRLMHEQFRKIAEGGHPMRTRGLQSSHFSPRQ